MSTEANIEHLLRDLLARAEGRGFLSVKQEGDGTVVTLTPANPQAARIEAYAEDSDPMVSVQIGQKIVIEVLGSKSQSLMDAVRMVCEAALAGDVEEDVWGDGSAITKSIGKIQYGGHVHTYRWYGNVAIPTDQRHFQYEPYVPDRRGA